jgi:hypothetical protein
LIVRVKYCGGCNSSYDRPAFVKRVQDAFPSVRFTFSADALTDAGVPDFALLVCGCPVECAAREAGEAGKNLRGTFGRCAVSSQDAFLSVCDEIRRAGARLDSQD